MCSAFRGWPCLDKEPVMLMTLNALSRSKFDAHYRSSDIYYVSLTALNSLTLIYKKETMQKLKLNQPSFVPSQH